MTGVAVEISWTAPAPNGEAITSYDVLVLKADGATFSAAAGTCTSNPSGTLSTAKCTITLTDLRTAPYSLILGSPVRAKVRAVNARGPGPYSQVNSASSAATIQTEPGQVQGLAFLDSTSTKTTNDLSWTLLTGATATGGSAITGYTIEVAPNPSSPIWSTIGTVSAATSTYTATGRTGGTTYLYRVSAQNLHGPGIVSTQVSALAAEPPDTPAAPTTSQVATGVRVTWIPPAFNHLAITEYEVVIADAGGTFAE